MGQAWVWLLYDCNRALGVGQSTFQVTFSLNNSELYMMIKNWSLQDIWVQQPAAPQNLDFLKYRDFALKDDVNANGQLPFKQNNTYLLLGTTQEISPQDGLPGQGTANPLALFKNHRVLKVGSTYFDPSYGLKYTGHQDFLDQAIESTAWWTPYDHDWDGGAITGFPEAAVDFDIDGDGDKTGNPWLQLFWASENTPDAANATFIESEALIPWP